MRVKQFVPFIAVVLNFACALFGFFAGWAISGLTICAVSISWGSLLSVPFGAAILPFAGGASVRRKWFIPALLYSASMWIPILAGFATHELPRSAVGLACIITAFSGAYLGHFLRERNFTL